MPVASSYGSVIWTQLLTSQRNSLKMISGQTLFSFTWLVCTVASARECIGHLDQDTSSGHLFRTTVNFVLTVTVLHD